MTAAAPFRYAAFISYSHADEAEAGRLHRALENFRLPTGVAAPAGMPSSRGRIAPVFRDREELSSSPDLSAVIREALANASALIVICSPKAKASRWVNAEIETFKRLRGEGRVYAFLIEGEPQESFPPALLKKLGPDGELTDAEGEPLAADIRPGKDGWKLGVLKIAAGLLEIGLDSLRQRESQRERRRLLAITGLSTAVAAVAVGLASWALHASSVARNERARAEREAKTATATAEFMVDLFEIADPGEARGRKVTAEEILKRGVARIEEGLKDEPAVQGELMYAMGRANRGLGLYADAAAILAKARDRQAVAGADPIRIHETDIALATVEYERMENNAAARRFEGVVKSLADAADGRRSRLALAAALTGMADVKARKEEDAAAIEIYRATLSDLEKNGLRNSEEFARASLGLARPLMFTGSFQEAIAALSTAREAFAAVKGPDDIWISIVENDLAGVYYLQQDVAQAADHYRRALSVQRVQLGDAHPETAITKNNLARMLLEQGELDDAHALLSEAIATQRQFAHDRNADFAFYLNTMGVLDAERGDFEASVGALKEALGLAADNSHRLFGSINYNLGRALCLQGDVEAGLALVRAGREALAAHYPAGDGRFAEADEFESRCLAATGDRNGARRLAALAADAQRAARGENHFFTKRAEAWLRQLS